MWHPTRLQTATLMVTVILIGCLQSVVGAAEETKLEPIDIGTPFVSESGATCSVSFTLLLVGGHPRPRCNRLRVLRLCLGCHWLCQCR